MEMSVNLHLSGETASYIDALVKRGLAANKTEAIRLTIVRSMETEKKYVPKSEADRFSQAIMERVWNNPKDEKASKFYVKRYLRGRKA